MTGYKADEIVGKNLRLLRGPETDVAAQTELRDAFSSGRAARVLLKNYRKDGTTFLERPRGDAPPRPLRPHHPLRGRADGRDVAREVGEAGRRRPRGSSPRSARASSRAPSASWRTAGASRRRS